MTRALPFFLLPGLLLAVDPADDAKNAAQNDSTPIPKVTPLVKWTFEKQEAGTLQGKAVIEPVGPQKPVYPGFEKGNKAAVFTGKESYIQVRESDLPEVNLRFVQGDTLSIECWVNAEDLANGKYVYLIGKGRNKAKGFTAENQNWALRLKGEDGEARPCFLFRSRSKDGKENYHRWVSKEGFNPGSGWHHVAVTYTFGKPESMKAYVDGKKTAGGVWDIAGKSAEPPVTDADDVMIGTGYGGGPSNTLTGALDEIAIYREVLPEALLAQRYQFQPPPPPVDVKKLPKGKVLVQICEEGVPPKNSWPAMPPQATESYTLDAFGLSEVPQKYVETGVRGDRPIPYLLRAASVVKLPAGKHRLLLRGRSATRLVIDGKPFLDMPFAKSDTGGHGRVSEQDVYLNLGPDFRFAPPGTQETWAEFETQGGDHLFVVESMIGGVVGSSKKRPETGETVVAISYEGTENWELVGPGKTKVAYNDAGWTDYEKKQNAWLVSYNAERRAKVRAQHDGYWSKRREAAQKWLASAPAVKVPAPVKGYPTNNEIDRFLNTKIAAVSAQYSSAKKDGVNFYKEVMPILEANCFSCHQGSKTKGDLKLDSLADVLKGGESDGPAVVPGQPEKSSLVSRVSTDDEDYIMPPKGHPLTAEQIDVIKRWISEGATWPEMNVDRIEITNLSDDLAFLRRVTLDTVGVTPTVAEIEAFTADKSPNKRAKVIDRLLADSRWADKWMGYWQDVLAENPNILNPTLNNTGPFRWYLHEALEDDRPMDLMVTELLRMQGSERFGGPAGFGTASGNDVPMAAKGTIVSTAFLGVEMKCARCHDAPAHKSLQQDLFELAAMLGQKAMDVPKTSSVPMDKLHEGGRKPLIQVTLQPGSKVEPAWPFKEFVAESVADTLAEDPKDPRDRLAALVTAPQNERFAQVIANRMWQQYMGRGIVEPVEDWEKGKPSHPELLQWLGREFVRGGYSLKNLSRLILNSHAYQRATDTALTATSPLFTSPAPRRLSAEQIVDSLFFATGKPFKTEEVSLDVDGRRDMKNSITLGNPTRAWMLASTSNERDRPSLSLPRIQAVCDVLEAFGWRGARQDPVSNREKDPNALQPAILGNGTVGVWLTRLSDDHGITELAQQDMTLDQFVDTLYLRLLTRHPSAEERAQYTAYLKEGFETRRQQPEARKTVPRYPVKYVSWTNHLDAEANALRIEEEAAARRGDPPTDRLTQEWRNRLEDVLWAMMNAPEWVFAP
ncbi:Concanavalin A-like lectin/glucanases superfamily protein [Prosthecobacter debontii]|uniref:Concanavalin A-like lectin/glucanases superfamily protein n=1 Tax=Prosthecobacter debontii TaxID=48467 RepID=A0A1T4Y0B2_9BACT|nr:DUF1553 domain-containing protein [Prosthecobacter debontii]SKA95264.1 Concanavalin A-like lectin/glucanases superfamily protein [Prosthecobacter debontii]